MNGGVRDFISVSLYILTDILFLLFSTRDEASRDRIKGEVRSFGPKWQRQWMEHKQASQTVAPRMKGKASLHYEWRGERFYIGFIVHTD
jgi:hypothetical protein